MKLDLAVSSLLLITCKVHSVLQIDVKSGLRLVGSSLLVGVLATSEIAAVWFWVAAGESGFHHGHNP